MQYYLIIICLSLALTTSMLYLDVGYKQVFKISSILFFVRSIFSILFLVFVFPVIFKTESNINLYSVLIAVFAYVSLYIIYSKVFYRSLLRSSELVSRFTLDALPGEQLSQDSAKRDGIISPYQAFLGKTDLVSKSLSLANLESQLRIFSFEPLFILLCMSFGILFQYSLTDIQFPIQFYLINSFIGGALILFSALVSAFTLLTVFFKFGDKGFENTFVSFSSKAIKIFYLLTLLCSIIVFLYYILQGKFVEGLYQSYVLFFVTAASIFYASIRKDKKSYFIVDRIKFNDYEIRSVLEIKQLDLTNYLHIVISNKNFVSKEFFNMLLKELDLKQSLYMPIKACLLEINSEIENGKVSVYWKGERVSLEIENNLIDSVSQISNVIFDNFGLSIKNEFVVLDLIQFLKSASTNEVSYSHFSNLEYKIYQYMKDVIMQAHNSGIFISDVIGFCSDCLDNMEEEDTSLIFASYIRRHTDVLSGKDGMVRVVFCDDATAFDTDLVESVMNKISNRNISPLVFVGEDLEIQHFDHLEFGKYVVLNQNAFPNSVKYFPLARI